MKVEATKIQKYEIDVDPVQVFNQMKDVMVQKIHDEVRKSRMEGFVPAYDEVFFRDGKWYGVSDMCGRGRDIEKYIRDASYTEICNFEALRIVSNMVNNHDW